MTAVAAYPRARDAEPWALGGRVVRLAALQVLSPELRELRFVLQNEERLTFRAGQFVTFAELGRSYSIASPPGDHRVLRFLVRAGGDRRPFDGLARLPLGSEMTITGPHGSFVLDGKHRGDVVFCAAGTGVAPVLPMLAELASRRSPFRRRLYWGIRSESDLRALPEIQGLCEASRTALHVHVSAPSVSWTGCRGRITEAVARDAAHLRTPVFYVAGPAAMVRQLRDALAAAGIDVGRRVRHDKQLA